MRFSKLRTIATLAEGDEPTDDDTDKNIDEGEADASDKEAEKEKDGDGEPEFDAGDGEDDEPVVEDDVEEGDGGEGGGDTPPTPAPVDDVPAEQQPRHDTGVNSVDIVVKASNIIRNAQDIASESYGSKKVLDEMFDQADGTTQALGHIALELGCAYKAVDDATSSCNALVGAKEALSDNFYKDGMNQIGLEAIHVLATRISGRFVMKQNLPKRIARESFHNTGSSQQTKRGVAIEGISDMVKSMIDAICDMFRRILKWIKEFFSGAEKKVKRCEAISKELVKRIAELDKERKALTKEKQALADELFGVCQKFDPDKAGEALSHIPPALKSKEELVKKNIQERGYRMRRSEIPTFYFSSTGFCSPVDMDYSKDGQLRKIVDFMKGYFSGNEKVVDAVDGVLSAVKEASAGQPTDDQASAADSDSGVDAALSKLVALQRTVAETGEAVDVNSPAAVGGDTSGVNNDAVKVMVQSRFFLPSEHEVHYYLPAKDDATTIRAALGDLGVKIETRAGEGTREDGLVDHNTFDKIEKGLGDYVERFMKEVNEIIEAQVKLVDKDSKKLVVAIEEIKKKSGEGWSLSAGNTEVLNNVTKMVTRVMTEVAPKLSKLILSFMTDFLKHSHQSLTAYGMCLEMVK